MTTHAAVSQNARGGMVGAQGRRSVLQLAAEAEAERKALVAELLAGLGRPASAIDRVAIGALSAAMIQSRRLRRQGRNGSEERRLIAQMMGELLRCSSNLMRFSISSMGMLKFEPSQTPDSSGVRSSLIAIW